jgi:hypothetical protein
MIASPLNAIRPPSRRRWVGLTIAALALHASLFGQTTSCAAAVDGMSDVNIVSNLYGQTRLRVPHAYYMSGPVGAIFNANGRLSLEMALPEMRPRKAQIPLRGEKGSAEWLKSLEENRQGLRLTILPRESSKNYFESQSRLFRSAYTKREDGRFGLVFYVRERCEQKRQGTAAAGKPECYVASEEYFLSPPFSDGNAVRFNCSSEKVPNPLIGCTAWTTLGKLDLEYSFRRSELHRWREIDQAIRDFVQRLIVE